jgi:hypothetical protein
VVHEQAGHFAWGYLVGGDYFSLFGKAPLHGRWLTPEDDRPGAPRVAVLGHPFWRRHFGADPGVVGKTVWLDARHAYTVVGIAPRRFQGQGLAMDVYLPMAHWGDVTHGLDDPERADVDVLARMAGGWSRERAAGALAGIALGLDESRPLSSPGAFPRQARLLPLAGPEAAWDDPMTGRAKVLMAVVALVLRQAGGLVAAGLVLGLLAAQALGRLLAGMLFGVEPHDPASLVAVAAVLGAAGLAAAWLPARSAARVDPAAVLRGE